MKKRLLSILLILAILLPVAVSMLPVKAAAASTQTIENLVVFVTFSGENEDVFEKELPSYGGQSTGTEGDAIRKLFDSNITTAGADTSFKHYISVITDGHIQVNNHFVKLTLTGTASQYDGGSVQSDDALLQACIPALSHTIADGESLDANGDGLLDHLVLVVQAGDSSKDSSSFYPHSTTFDYGDHAGVTIKGLSVFHYNVINSSALTSGSMQKQGVISHEFMHSLGLPDLYRNAGVTEGTPVGQWDIMASAGMYQQFPLTYMRYRQGWLDGSMPVLTQASADSVTHKVSVTLNVVTQTSGDRAVQIKTPLSESQSFVIEYRKKGQDWQTDTYGFESKLPGSGLLVYRVDDSVDGLTNTAGQNYIYVFRPGTQSVSDATETSNGLSAIWDAAIDPAAGETTYGSTDLGASYTSDTLFYADGSNSGIRLSNIQYVGDTQISFDVTFADYDASGVWPSVGESLTSTPRLDPMLCADENDTLYTMTFSGDYDAQLYRLSGGTWQASASLSDVMYDGALYASGANVYFSYVSSQMSGGQYLIKCQQLNQNTWQQSNSLSAASPNMVNLIDYSGALCCSYVDSNTTWYLRRVDTGAEITHLSLSDLGGGSTFSSPQMCVYGGRLYLVFGVDTGPAKVMRFDGMSWETVWAPSYSTTVDGMSIGGQFSIAASDSGIHVLIATSGLPMKLACSESGDAGTFVEDNSFAALTLKPQTAMLCVAGASLYTVWPDALSGKVYAKTNASGTWNDFYGITASGDTVTRPAAAIAGGKLYVATFSTGNDTRQLMVKAQPLASNGNGGTQPTAYAVRVTPPQNYTDTVLHIDGVEHTITRNGNLAVTEVESTDAKTAVMYCYNQNNIPIGMYVWTLSFSAGVYTATAVPELENLLSYEGVAMRVGGAFGLRIKTGIDENTRAALLSNGTAGYTMTECGTLAMSAGRHADGYPLVLNGQKTVKGVAYGWQNGRFYNSIFETKNGRNRFTSVLTGVPGAQYNTDFVFRGYICLTDGSKNIILYGPPVSRSMYYIACQLMAAGNLQEGTTTYATVHQVIATVESA